MPKQRNSHGPELESYVDRVFIWDLVESLILFHTLLTGSFAAKDSVSKVWNKIKVSSKSQIKTRSTKDFNSGLCLFLRLAFRLGLWLRVEKKMQYLKKLYCTFAFYMI